MTADWGAGAAAFADELAAYAAGLPHVPLRRLAAELRRPLGVGVVGRRGVGRATVGRALRASGVRVTADAAADLRVLVIAEALKPEDRALLTAPMPTLIVLTKADLLRSERGGPLVAARECAREVEIAAGAPVEVMIGLLAAVHELDSESWAALRTLVEQPADLGSVDAFVAAEHSVPRDTRDRLLGRLDRFGVAHAVLALADGAAPPVVLARLRELSNVAAVLSALHRVGAAVEYRRLCRVLAQLRCELSVSEDAELARFVRAHATAMAVMTAAVEVVEADGVNVDRADEPDAHARRAVHWTAYGRGPVGPLHRACAADIARGSLRLMQRGTR